MPYKNYYPCSIDGCELQVKAKGWCSKHWARWKRNGDPLTYNPSRGGGYFKAVNPDCTIEDCNKRVVAKGFCKMHYRRNSLYGDPNVIKNTGSVIGQGGYVQIRTITGNGKKGAYEYEHRLVMEENIGRKLEANESVHHKNGNRADNRIENLELWSKAQPAGQRVEDKVKYAIEILELYAPDLLTTHKAGE